MKIFSKLTIIIFVVYIIINNNAKADFFSLCKIKGEDLDNVKYIIDNGNNKFIPYKIKELKNKTFQQALYLFFFYKNSILPDDIAELIGIDVIKQNPQFKNYAINYILKNNNDEYYVKKHFENMNLQKDDLLFILKNKYFQEKKYSNNFIFLILKRVFEDKILSDDDIMFFVKKFKLNITDNMIFNQIRLKLWKSSNNINKIKILIKNKDLVFKVEKLEEFNKSINKKTVKNVKINNKQKKTVIKLTKKQKQNICAKYIGYDEYIDLFCIEKINNNKENIEKILKNNLNPDFLPEIWFKHRLLFVREKINNNELNDDVLNVINNSGVLHRSDLYTQKFLAGFVYYLQNDYEKAIINFNECVKIASFSDYISKAYYWLGVCYRRIDEKKMAYEAFKMAKKHVFTFYGQLSASEIGDNPEKNIKDHILSFDKNPDILCNDINFILGYIKQYKTKDKKVLFSWINKNTDKTKLFNALVILKNDFDSELLKTFGFYSLRYNTILDDVNFPLIEHSDDSFINAVIKKESNFKKVIGKKGERGIMQIMPSTGRALTKQMNIKYNSRLLLNNNKYNLDIGKYYLEQLLYDFDDNKILALASYNAGKKNVKKWIKKNGDPRYMYTNEEIAKWIELIPFSFTREYVPNILGFEMVYDVIKELNKESAKI